ncbi:MAG: cell division protein FtsZ [Alphaproteobacteria bacterium]|nr:cell division protein FtsZ [Alphaproteobacteria bacterium]MCY4318945.1 cell division protein FtsZ [Alphaproteobacteria bacterium]
MSAITFHSPPDYAEMRPRITVIGVGGAGGNAVNNMIRSALQGVEFVVANTDAQALGLSDAPNRIRLGANLTNGLGAGAEPDIGRAAAEEALDEVMVEIEDSHMLFITAGMGGGTGTGAAPVIARAARERGVLTVGVVTKPFNFEGTRRMRAAENGIEELAKFVDTLIVIPNQNLFQVADPKTTLAEAFQKADDVLQSGVRGVTDLMIKPGLVNLDFADIRSVMREMGKAMMGTGEAEGEDRAREAAEDAIDNPLLDDTSMRGAQAVLINITGGFDMGLMEVDEAANRIRQEVDESANIVFGSTLDESMNNKMRVSVVATGIDSELKRVTDPIASHVVPIQAFAEDEIVDEETAEAPLETPVEAARDAVLEEIASESSTTQAPEEAVAEASDPSEEIREDEAEATPAYKPAFGKPFVPEGASTPRKTQLFRDPPAKAEPEESPVPPRRSWFGLPGLLGREPEETPKEASVLEMSIGSGKAVPAPAEDDDQLNIPAFLKRQAN